ncbi:1,4-alpha-glucan branching protein [Actinomadura sp. KC216]|uniref:maltokinase N-terminal cap-like domain-containing protein n=1 Tax=Actinomadura sp. KC216 TaxID=2530370 RepID=UPI0010516B46|nr:1,4-alpha-glucan branching protein [Actinomadura sp. KC216]TDB83123.1 1,4-alpha-glucan branching protein [Actinomadura sp. KC216]
MAFIHNTTMTPGKLDLLAAWLPGRPWYAGSPDGPELSRAGGFRLDDPDGEVGIEFMVVTDTSGGAPVAYHVPATYRGAPLDGAEDALIGTSEHGVLGRRWVYDATRDPVAVGQILALLQGRAEPQHQSQSDTPDPSVISDFTAGKAASMAALTSTEDTPDGTDIAVQTEPHGALTIRIVRVLRKDQETTTPKALGSVTAQWHSSNGEQNRGLFAVLNP